MLIGAGAHDRALPVANQRHLARVLPNARLKVYADAAHGFFIQHRRDFVRRVQRFLAMRRAARRPGPCQAASEYAGCGSSTRSATTAAGARSTVTAIDAAPRARGPRRRRKASW